MSAVWKWTVLLETLRISAIFSILKLARLRVRMNSTNRSASTLERSTFFSRAGLESGFREAFEPRCFLVRSAPNAPNVRSFGLLVFEALTILWLLHLQALARFVKIGS